MPEPDMRARPVPEQTRAGGDRTEEQRLLDTVWGELAFTVERTRRDGRDAGQEPAGDTAGKPRRATCASGRARADRAAQFMPFAALRGYYELVRQQERVPDVRHELTEEEAAELSHTVGRIKRGDIVRVTYYDRDAYVTMTGCVARIDVVYREIVVVKTRIPLDDVRALAIVEHPNEAGA